ncbi:MAG: hypothetical protein IJ225_02415 [Solobacterium sp.]|nr:hypothetical protein [Solobacterium sp.]
MTIGDLIFYALDIFILFMLVRMRKNSREIEVPTSLGPRWVIPAIFFAIAILGLINYTGLFRWVQTIALVVMGIIYWGMNSGLSPKGVVMIGRLYPYEKSKPITVDDEHHNVTFNIRRSPTPVNFLPEQMKEVRNYLSKYAGIAKHAVRTK